MIRTKIKNITIEALLKLQQEKILPRFELPEFYIEDAPECFGDYATNVAMAIAKIAKMPPMKLAQIIADRILKTKNDVIGKIAIAEPGFINFVLKAEYLQKQVGEILKREGRFGNLDIGRGKKIQVEFISANPTGPLTVGNARGGPLGDVLADVLHKAGFEVEKAYYINDYGVQILSLGHSVVKDSEAKYAGPYIDELHKRVQEKDPYKAGIQAAEIIINEMIKPTTRKLGIKYDEWFSEAELHKAGEVDRVLDWLTRQGLIYEKDGAKYFKSTEFGDNRDRVVVKADGSKTYLAGDIAYHKYKFEKKKFNKVIDIWGADHHGDVPGLQSAVEALGHKGKLDVLLLQFVTILAKGERQRMSKRKGIFITMDELLGQIGKDVVRFFFLQKSADTHLNFDLTLAKEQSQQNPLYYVQYAHARICSIFRMSRAKEVKVEAGNSKLLTHPSELKLIKKLIKFPEIIEDVALGYVVHILPGYAIDLAAAFHQFYRDCRVLSEDEKLTGARLALASAARNILGELLLLMGLEAPEKM